MEQMGNNIVIQQEYDKIIKKKEFTTIAQITINNLCDLTRETVRSNSDNYTGDINAVNFIAITKNNKFLRGKNKKLVY